MIPGSTQRPEGPPALGLHLAAASHPQPTASAAGPSPSQGTLDTGCSWQVLRASVSPL